MRSATHTILVFLAVLLMTAGCTFETSHNGSLDGYWQLTTVDSLPTGPSTDMRESGFFWAVQSRLLEMMNVREGMVRVFFRFEQQDGCLILGQPVADNRAVGDSVITDVSVLRPYGLTRLCDTLRVLQLDDDRMVLESQLVRMYFRKY